MRNLSAKKRPLDPGSRPEQMSPLATHCRSWSRGMGAHDPVERVLSIRGMRTLSGGDAAGSGHGVLCQTRLSKATRVDN